MDCHLRYVLCVIFSNRFCNDFGDRVEGCIGKFISLVVDEITSARDDVCACERKLVCKSILFNFLGCHPSLNLIQLIISFLVDMQCNSGGVQRRGIRINLSPEGEFFAVILYGGRERILMIFTRRYTKERRARRGG